MNKLEEKIERRLVNRLKTSLDEIYKCWKYDSKSCKNYDHYYWIDIIDDKYYIFDAEDANRWIKSILDYVIIEHSSNRLRIQLVRKVNIKQHDSNIQNTIFNHDNIHNHMHFDILSLIQYFNREFYNSYNSQNISHDHRINHRISSIFFFYFDLDEYTEFNRYFIWLIDKYSVDKEKFFLIKDKLHDHNLNLKAIKKLENIILEKWDMTWEIVNKIHHEIKVFQNKDIY